MDDAPFSRITKFWLDTGHTDAASVMSSRANHLVVVCCGDDVSCSAVLQLALFTCVNLASRCFPGAVRVAASSEVLDAKILTPVAMGRSIREALVAEFGTKLLKRVERERGAPSTIVLGDVCSEAQGLRMSFDGWIVSVGPIATTARMPERPYLAIVGVLGAAIAISEIFMSFSGLNPAAMRRQVTLSLWDPAQSAHPANARGIPVEFLPRAFWILGLGHLGNALAWTIASLSYPATAEVVAYLNDFDSIGPENYETSMLFRKGERGLKTRSVASWLQTRGIQTRLVEREFDSAFRLQASEPALAFCGFDKNSARRALEHAGFRHVIEIGLGGNASNFDTIGLHHWPNPRAATELWPDLDAAHQSVLSTEHERLAETEGYVSLGDNKCGLVQFAGKAVAIPFVGAIAACFAVAEALRIAHRGPGYHQLRFRIGALELSPVSRAHYLPVDSLGVQFLYAPCHAQPEVS